LRSIFGIGLIGIALAAFAAEGCSSGKSAQTSACPGALQSCGAACIDVRFDPENCGACGTSCAKDQVCSDGQCGASCGDATNCSGKCVDTRFDPANCGGCAKPCSKGLFCSAGKCGFECSGGSTRCGDTCVDTADDPKNCGGCGKACPLGQVCQASQCVVTCLGGATLCGSKCVDTQNDPAHCGDCPTVCSAGTVCQAGKCLLTCLGGATACNGKCVDLKADVANCGKCGGACPTGQVCGNGSCVAAPCNDGVQNGQESDVDCGGVCPACGYGKACQQANDCDSATCTGNKCAAAPSCAAILAAKPAAKDGVYAIDPDGPGGDAPFATHCLMSVLNGGWTLVQRTVWDFDGQSSQLVTGYAKFYASTIGAGFAEQAFRMAGKHWPTVNVAKDHLLVNVARRAADGSSCLPLYYMATNGTWTVPPGGGAAVNGINQPVTIFNQASFSTTDNGPGTSCVTMYGAVPWTYTGCCTTCPTFAGGYFSPARPMVSYLTTLDAFGNDVNVQCNNDAPVISNGYYGLNAMAYYMR
jgi:hypothetical protein